jgi:hypothetical protein
MVAVAKGLRCHILIGTVPREAAGRSVLIGRPGSKPSGPRRGAGSDDLARPLHRNDGSSPRSAFIGPEPSFGVENPHCEFHGNKGCSKRSNRKCMRKGNHAQRYGPATRG